MKIYEDQILTDLSSCYSHRQLDDTDDDTDPSEPPWVTPVRRKPKQSKTPVLEKTRQEAKAPEEGRAPNRRTLSKKKATNPRSPTPELHPAPGKNQKKQPPLQTTIGDFDYCLHGEDHRKCKECRIRQERENLLAAQKFQEELGKIMRLWPSSRTIPIPHLMIFISRSSPPRCSRTFICRSIIKSMDSRWWQHHQN